MKGFSRVSLRCFQSAAIPGVQSLVAELELHMDQEGQIDLICSHDKHCKQLCDFPYMWAQTEALLGDSMLLMDNKLLKDVEQFTMNSAYDFFECA